MRFAKAKQHRPHAIQQDMTTGSPARHILHFTIPIAIGGVLQQVYNMTDTAIVGHTLGPQALAAVGSTGTIMFLLTGFAQGLTNGFAVLTSQRFGAGDRDGVKRSVASGLILSVLCTLFLTGVFTSGMHMMLDMMHTPTDIYGMAYTYINVIALGTVTTIFYNLFSGFLRSVGNSKAPLLFLIISASLNTVLDLWMIISLKMGVAGAAWATVISQGVSALLCLIYLLKKATILIPERGEWIPKRGHVTFQLTMGTLMAMQYGITAIGTMIMQSAINLFGSVAVAAFTAANRIQSIVTQPMPAIGTTMATFCGQNWGKHTIMRIKEGVKAATVMMVGYSLMAALLLRCMLPRMMGLFFSKGTDIGKMMPWAETYLYLSMLFFIPLAMIFICRNSLEGCGYAKLTVISGIVELVARWITTIIAIKTGSYLLSVAGDPVAWLAAGTYTTVALFLLIRRLEKEPRIL